MKGHQWVFYGLSFLLVIAAVLLFLAAAGTAVRDALIRPVWTSELRLIHQTNHQAVLQACQNVLSDPQAAGFPKGKDFILGSQNGVSPPAALPAVLRNLDFESMLIRDQHVEIWFGGGFGGWGYSTAPIWGYWGAVFPDVNHLELIPGLWLWSEYPLPRDLSKNPYYSTSIALLTGGAAALIAAIAVAFYAFGRKAA